MSAPRKLRRTRPARPLPDPMIEIAAILQAAPPPSPLSLALINRGHFAVCVRNLRTLLEEAEEVYAASIRYGTGVNTRTLLEHMRTAEVQLAHAVERAADDAGLVASEGG